MVLPAALHCPPTPRALLGAEGACSQPGRAAWRQLFGGRQGAWAPLRPVPAEGRGEPPACRAFWRWAGQPRAHWLRNPSPPSSRRAQHFPSQPGSGPTPTAGRAPEPRAGCPGPSELRAWSRPAEAQVKPGPQGDRPRLRTSWETEAQKAGGVTLTPWSLLSAPSTPASQACSDHGPHAALQVHDLGAGGAR